MAAVLAAASPVAAQCLPLEPREPEGNFIVPGSLGGIVYHRAGARELSLDAYVQAPTEARPLVILVHGGGGATGSRIAYVGQLLETLTDAGFNWASIDYRLDPSSPAGAIDDVVAALAFVRCHAPALGTDPARIVLLGEDSGAGLVLEAAARARPAVQGVVLIGGRYEPASAASLADSPQLVIHGGNDSETPTASALGHCDAVRRARGRCQALVVDGASHRSENWWPHQWGYKSQLVDWLTATVGTAGTHVPQRTRLQKRLMYDPAERLSLDLWRPSGERPAPLVVLVHGGGWEAGDRVTYITPLFAPLARAGLAWASIDYRLTPRAMHAAQLDDVRRAMAWLRRHATALGVDAARMALVGESASGQMVAQLATQDTSLAGVVSFYGVYDFAPMVTDASPRSLLRRLFGYTALDGDAKRALRRYSPLHGVGRGMAPILLVHGTNERLWEQGLAMTRALEAAGVDHALVRLEGAPHGMENWEGHPEWLGYKDRVVSWLRARLARPRAH